MNLIIDIGNTQTKYALFNDEKMLEFRVSHAYDFDIINSWKEKCSDANAVIVSSVQDKPVEFLNVLNSKFAKLIFLDHNTPTPLENLYESKETLGYDRLAACVGAHALFPNTNLLVIDAGTAITFDFVNEKNQYLGGTISPGLKMRFKALNTFTNKLPLLEETETFDLFGKNTSQAIISGVQNSLLFEIEIYINRLKEKHIDAEIFLTGGDSEFIYSNLKNQLFLNKRLLLSGLNAILNYNNS